MSHVGLIGENSIEYINILLDIWNNGDCAVLIDWRTPFKSAVEMMKEASVSKCYIEKKRQEKMKSIDSGIEYIVYEPTSNVVKILPKEIYNKFSENYTRDEAVVIYSSGTTGKAKGIILSHFAINTNADAIIDYMKPDKNDCIYIIKTLSHSSTITGELLVDLKTQTKLIVSPTIMIPRITLNNILKFKVTILCLNPTLLSMYVDEYNKNRYNLSSLKTIYVSGSILNEKTYKSAHETLENISIYNVYGLSEAGPRVSAQRIECNSSNSVGKVIKGVEIVMVDDGGGIVEKGRRGVIHVKTPSMFNGYITGKEKLKSLYEDWLNTGDIGYFDEYNELHIVDRVDDVIIINSHKIYPADIEKVIREYELIKDCVVIYGSDENLMICFYELYNSENFYVDLLIKHCKNYLSLYEIPQKWIFLKSISKTYNNKISKNDIKVLLKIKDK